MTRRTTGQQPCCPPHPTLSPCWGRGFPSVIATGRLRPARAARQSPPSPQRHYQLWIPAFGLPSGQDGMTGVWTDWAPASGLPGGRDGMTCADGDWIPASAGMTRRTTEQQPCSLLPYPLPLLGPRVPIRHCDGPSAARTGSAAISLLTAKTLPTLDSRIRPAQWAGWNDGRVDGMDSRVRPARWAGWTDVCRWGLDSRIRGNDGARVAPDSKTRRVAPRDTPTH